MLIACRCVRRTHIVMLSWWVRRVKGACMPALLQRWCSCWTQFQSHKMKIACRCVYPTHKMLIACRCVSRTHNVMLSWWVHRVKRACMPAMLKSVHANPASMVMCMSNSTSESQDEDSTLMCLSNSQDDDSITMCHRIACCYYES